MKEPKISVIIPVWNTEKYILKCINSLKNQTYKNIEFIFIDDASSDNSVNIIKENQTKNMILIQNKTHKGAAYSRNIGIKKATGLYIGSVDSDDFIPPTYYEQLMQSILKNNADCAVCDMLHIYVNNEQSNIVIAGCDGKVNKLNLINNSMAASSCNKLIKKELLEQNPYPIGKMNEDVAVIIPALVNAKKIEYVPGLCYNYVQHKSSIQNKTFSEQRFDMFDIIEITLKRIENCKDFETIKEALIYNQLITMFIYVFPKINNNKQRYNYLKQYGNKILKYDIGHNKFFWQFLSHESKKNFLYYKTLFYLLRKKHYYLCNKVMGLALVYKKYFAKNVTKEITKDLLIKEAKKQAKKKSKIKISVVIPNYNYELFLYERLYSILYQKQKVSEIIILDDVSTDNSREMIDDLVKCLSPYVNIKKNYNEVNSGSPFKQWEKGFNLATEDYVWIAEADDYCENNMLSLLVKQIKKEPNVRLAYVDTAFINGEGKKIIKSIKPEIDILKTKHWDKTYINDGKDEFQNYAYLNCTIANVSSVLFKKDDYTDLFNLSGKFRQAGDWLFYVNVMLKGKVAYVNKPINYYRVHGNNVTSTTKKEKHLQEIMAIHDYFDKNYHLNDKQKKEIQARYKLKKVWNLD